MFTGFGQLPFLLDTHFDVRGRLGRIIPALIQTKTQIGIGLDEPVCLYYNNGIGTVYGKGGVFIVDVSRASSFSKQYFLINNVSVSYLTVGDIYNFKENKLFPSTRKHPISQPLYKTQLNSIDILSSY
jgi:cyanophycinase